jgi:hypothetical protein
MHWRIDWVRELSRDDYEVLLAMIADEQRKRDED